MTKLPPDHPHIKQMVETGQTASIGGPKWRDGLRWVGAGVLVLMAHGAAAYAVQAMQLDDRPEGVAVAAMMVELVPELVAPDAEEDALVPVEELVPEPVSEPGPELVPEPAIEDVTEMEKPEPVKEIMPPEPPLPDIVEAVKPEVVVPKPAKKPKLEKPEQKPKPKPKKSKPAPKPRKSAAPQAVESGTKVVASRAGQSSGVSGVVTARWSAKLQAHLERQKRFLQRKMASQASGTVQMSFTIDPSGNVLSARVAATSGKAVLDQLALEMVQRASPVPAPPPALAKARMPISVPVRFR